MNHLHRQCSSAPPLGVLGVLAYFELLNQTALSFLSAGPLGSLLLSGGIQVLLCIFWYYYLLHSLSGAKSPKTQVTQPCKGGGSSGTGLELLHFSRFFLNLVASVFCEVTVTLQCFELGGAALQRSNGAALVRRRKHILRMLRSNYHQTVVRKICP